MEIGTFAWWSRFGAEGPFETLVKIASEQNKFGGIKVNFLVPIQKGIPPALVERDSNVRYLRAFVPGDERIWDKWGPHPGVRSYTNVKVVRVDESTGLLLCTCDRCPHHFDGKIIDYHWILPRYIKNATDLAMRSMPCLPALPTAVAVQSPLTPTQKPDTTDRTFVVLREVVIALAKGEKPQPEDIDFLTGNLGKGPEYAIPAHAGK
ncbi:MAG: hypothetical protein Q7S70_02500 [bacterium]|nr:hypothetical protein [bacterium]